MGPVLARRLARLAGLALAVLERADARALRRAVRVRHVGQQAPERLRQLAAAQKEVAVGAGGVLDLFYDRWKLDLTLATPLYADAYRDLFEVRRSVL